MTISNEELIAFLKDISGFSLSLRDISAKAEDMLAKLQPPLRKIDLSNLDQRVPVRVQVGNDMTFDVYPCEVGANSPDKWESHSLKTDRWVFNDTGTNPWPEGCVVEVRNESGYRYTDQANNFRWGAGIDLSIQASRYVGPAAGWTE